MKVRLGKYPKWRYCRIFEKHMDKKYDSRWPDTYDKQDLRVRAKSELINRFYRFIELPNRRQKTYVRIDPWDVWSADCTMAHIISPLLQKMRDDLIGFPAVDNDDVPERLRSREDFTEEKWKYVLDEIIFAMNTIKDEDGWLSDEQQERVERGCLLLGKYFRNLWN